MIPVDREFILKVAPNFRTGKSAQTQARIIETISDVFASILNDYDINTAIRIAHFMGQVTHECAGFSTTEEFASGAKYEGREDLGNIFPGDGKKFKGRGLIQLTGRANYKRIGGILGLPLEENPDLAGEPILSLKIACEYWKSRKINSASDRDDLITVTKLVNGGLNGLEDRRKYLQKAKTAIARLEGLRVALNEGGSTNVLRRGSFGDAVGELQRQLVEKGFDVTIDNDFGPATELAVKLFQKENGLLVDGIVGQKTLSKLR